MSHPQQIDFIFDLSSKFPDFFKNVKVVEIGSLNINGTVRIFFDSCDYLGVDVGPGPGVDLVCEGQNVDHPDASYDTAISCECFEHNPYWRETFVNMHRMLRPGGLLVMTCATTGRPEHGTSRSSPSCSPLTIGKGWDYYRNLTKEDFYSSLAVDSMFSEHSFATKDTDLYFYGFKA